MENNEATKKNFNRLILSFLKGNEEFKKVLVWLIRRIVKKCRKEKKKRGDDYKKSPLEIFMTIA